MKVAILAGGLGSRISEETIVRPKPMIEIGGKPILWHIMKTYSYYGFKEFVIALGYKGEYIKDYFLNYHWHSRNLDINLASGEVKVYNGNGDDWIVHLIDTGLNTQTGGRVKRVIEFIGPESFMLTYGDGVSDINILELVEFHKKQGKLATLSAVRPPARFGGIIMDGDRVSHFTEKPQIGEGWINGGFFVLEPEVARYINGDDTIFEKEPLEQLVAEGQLNAFRHQRFWQCMDTLRDMRLLESLWHQDNAPWKVW